ncbi:hypothetical protein, partial [Actinoallomurus sp. NPDC052274]|uniref:hypothetical protein n=1 Tax=Actinoallomurus sp. NPDC052274 TaxID=3155420 RepID=UPI003449A16C
GTPAGRKSFCIRTGSRAEPPAMSSTARPRPAVERPEQHDVVDAVEEVGPKVALHGLEDGVADRGFELALGS